MIHGAGLESALWRRQSFLRLVEKAGVPRIQPYDMRYTAATLLLVSAVHPKVVSEMLGHSSVMVTLTVYRHMLPMTQRDSAEAMDRTFDGQLEGSTVEDSRRLS